MCSMLLFDVIVSRHTPFVVIVDSGRIIRAIKTSTWTAFFRDWLHRDDHNSLAGIAIVQGQTPTKQLGLFD